MKTSTLIISLIVVGLIIGGIFYFQTTNQPKSPQNVPSEPEATAPEEPTNQELPQQATPTASLQATSTAQSVTKTQIMKITSPAFANQESIPEKYTCDGANISPPLEFSDVPEDAKALALIVDDPDAPGKTWVHWTVWNISPDTTSIAEDSVPEDAVEGMTDFGQPGYGGPCPPSGEHRYFFKLYALDTELDLDPSAGKSQLLDAMKDHILAQDELVGVYAR